MKACTRGEGEDTCDHGFCPEGRRVFKKSCELSRKAKVTIKQQEQKQTKTNTIMTLHDDSIIVVASPIRA